MFLDLMKIWRAIRMASHFFVTSDITPNKTQNERLKVAFSSMFLQHKKSQRFGASSFSKFHDGKIPLPTLVRSYTKQKTQFAIGRNSERCYYHTAESASKLGRLGSGMIFWVLNG